MLLFKVTFWRKIAERSLVAEVLISYSVTPLKWWGWKIISLVFLLRGHYLGNIPEYTGECVMSVGFGEVFRNCNYELHRFWEALVLLDWPPASTWGSTGITQALPTFHLQMGRNRWSSFLKESSCKAFRAWQASQKSFSIMITILPGPALLAEPVEGLSRSALGWVSLTLNIVCGFGCHNMKKI